MPSRELFLPETVKTGGLVLPPSVTDEIERDRLELVDNLFEVAAIKKEWDKELKDIDPDLELLKAKPKTTVVGLKAGYWHIVRKRPGSPAYIKPLEYDNGEPRLPGSWMLDAVHLDDLQSDRAAHERRKLRRKAQAAMEHKRELEAEQRIYEMRDRIRFRDHTQILVRRSHKS